MVSGLPRPGAQAEGEPLEELEPPDVVDPALLAGRYRLVRELGAGGQGHTYLAIDEVSGSEVALKKFDLKAATDWKKVELFERECAVLRSIQHPCIPRYLHQFEEQGVFYLAMERVVGESLQQRRARGVRVTEAEVWRILHEVGAILDMLHGLQPPVIHRDIKPHNLLRRADGTIALVDFGAVRDMLGGGGGSTVAGTFGYMAPEQLHGQALPQTDVYGLGATVVALMTGREPEQLQHKGLRIDVRAEVSASPALVAVLQRMLEPDPDDRPRSVRDAMGSYAPPIEQPPAARTGQPEAAGPAVGAHDAPVAAEAFGPWEALARALPFPAAMGLSVAVFLLSVPFWLVAGLVLPLVLGLLGAGPDSPLRRAAEVVARVQRSLWNASRQAARAASSRGRQRRDKRLRSRAEDQARTRAQRDPGRRHRSGRR